MTVSVLHTDRPDDELWARIEALHQAVFGAPDELRVALEWPGTLLVWAEVDGRAVGYKLGYERKPAHFYSWMGGVHPDLRGRGVASALMERQHDLLRERGIRKVRTKTSNAFRSMLILNLRHGFDVVGTYTNGRGEPRVILDKRLT